MNDAAIVHGPLCVLRGSGTTAHLFSARGTATQRGHLMFTETLQQEQAQTVVTEPGRAVNSQGD